MSEKEVFILLVDGQVRDVFSSMNKVIEYLKQWELSESQANEASNFFCNGDVYIQQFKSGDEIEYSVETFTVK